MTELYAIQHYDGEIWKTIYLSSFAGDVLDTYMEITPLTNATLRLVWFGVDGLDFVATHARNFGVATLREAAQTA